MVWVRTPDDLFERPEVYAVGLDALALHHAALCYSNRNLTDGFVPEAKAATLLPVDAAPLIERLLGAGWWLEEPGGYRLVYLLDLQPTAEQVNAARASGRRRTAGYRSRGNGRRNGVSNVAGDTPPGRGLKPPTPDPVPAPVPDPGPGSGPVPGDPDRRAAGARSISPARTLPRGATAPAPSGNLTETTNARLSQIAASVRARNVVIYPTLRDEVALKSCAAPSELIADAYVAAATGVWDPGGDGWLFSNLSLHAVVDRLAGFEVERQLAGRVGLRSSRRDAERYTSHLGHVHGPDCTHWPSDVEAAF